MSDIVYKNFGFSTPFLRGYNLLKIPIVDEDGKSAWPELFPIARIDSLRESVGDRAFSAQMMLKYVPIDRARLEPGDLRFYDAQFDSRTATLGDVHITGMAVYWDPSGGGRVADGSVCVLIYRDDKNRHIYIHDVLYLNVPEEIEHKLGYQCDSVLNFMARYGACNISVETNGIGNALPEIMRDVALARGEKIIVTRIVNHKNKEMRILDAIEPVLTTGRLHTHTRVRTTPFLSEMLGWSPRGAGHDDGLDAVAGAICTNPVPVRPMGASAKIFTANTNFKL